MFRFPQTLKSLRLNTVSSLRRMARAYTFDASIPEYPSMPLLGTFDRSAFTKAVHVLAVEVPAAKTTAMLKAPEMKASLVDLPRVKSVDTDPSDPQKRLVILKVVNKAELSPVTLSFLEKEGRTLVPYVITLDYDYWTADDVIRAVLPEGLRAEAPSGFATIGHIAHLNLNAEYLPYKRLIGQVILDKNKKLRTVVNKMDTIHSVFRFFNMELIAGEPDFVVEHHESDCSFTFDFREVYWNSRLHTEHGRLVDVFKPEDVVADVFAGVGPFALPAAKKGCAVFANDLNPNSVKYLDINIDRNRVKNLVQSSCQDGREFILSVFRRASETPFAAYVPQISKTQLGLARRRGDKPAGTASSATLPSRRRISHFVMNLPDSAITFLDAFRGAFVSDEAAGLRELYNVMPMVHCHCFTRELDPQKAEADIRRRVEEKLGARLTTDVSFYLVRSVAPNKEMYCVSFRLPPDVPLSS